jgi:salicylate hydroxylase
MTTMVCLVPSRYYTKPLQRSLSAGRWSGIHRARLHAILLNKLGPTCTAHTSKRLVSYIQQGDPNKPLRLIFADGSDATCDILIGADGLKSAVRYSMVNELAAIAESKGDLEAAKKWRSFEKATFSGCLIYRTMIPSERLEQVSPDHPCLVCNSIVSFSVITFSEILSHNAPRSQFIGKNSVGLL